MTLYEQLPVEKKIRLKEESEHYPNTVEDLIESLEDVDFIIDLPLGKAHTLHDIFFNSVFDISNVFGIFNK